MPARAEPYEVAPNAADPECWNVERILDETGEDGAVEMAVFSGPGAEQRARGYARWMNSTEA